MSRRNQIIPASFDESVIAATAAVPSNTCKNVTTMYHPVVEGVNPSGSNIACLNKVQKVASNFTIANGTHILLFNPYAKGRYIGRRYILNGDGTVQALENITSPFDVEQYRMEKSVSGVIHVYCNTITGTDFTLSGQITGLALYDLPLKNLGYNDIGKYSITPAWSRVNVGLDDGITCVQLPTPDDFECTPEIYEDNDVVTESAALSQEPIKSGVVSAVPGGDHSIITPIDMGLYCPGSTVRLIYGGKIESDTIGRVWGFNAQTEDWEQLASMSFTIGFNQRGVDVTIPGNVTRLGISLVCAEGDNQDVLYSFFSKDPLLFKDTDLKYMVYIQGSLSQKNIVISGEIRKQVVPKIEYIPITQMSVPISYDPKVFEACALLSQMPSYGLVMRRSEYATLSPVTRDEVACIASGECGLADYWKSAVGILKKVGISPAGLGRKLLDKGSQLGKRLLDAAENAGYAEDLEEAEIRRPVKRGYCGDGECTDDLEQGSTRRKVVRKDFHETPQRVYAIPESTKTAMELNRMAPAMFREMDIRNANRKAVVQFETRQVSEKAKLLRSILFSKDLGEMLELHGTKETIVMLILKDYLNGVVTDVSDQLVENIKYLISGNYDLMDEFIEMFEHFGCTKIVEMIVQAITDEYEASLRMKGHCSSGGEDIEAGTKREKVSRPKRVLPETTEQQEAHEQVQEQSTTDALSDHKVSIDEAKEAAKNKFEDPNPHVNVEQVDDKFDELPDIIEWTEQTQINEEKFKTAVAFKNNAGWFNYIRNMLGSTEIGRMDWKDKVEANKKFFSEEHTKEERLAHLAEAGKKSEIVRKNMIEPEKEIASVQPFLISTDMSVPAMGVVWVSFSYMDYVQGLYITQDETVPHGGYNWCGNPNFVIGVSQNMKDTTFGSIPYKVSKDSYLTNGVTIYQLLYGVPSWKAFIDQISANAKAVGRKVAMYVDIQSPLQELDGGSFIGALDCAMFGQCPLIFPEYSYAYVTSEQSWMIPVGKGYKMWALAPEVAKKMLPTWWPTPVPVVWWYETPMSFFANNHDAIVKMVPFDSEVAIGEFIEANIGGPFTNRQIYGYNPPQLYIQTVVFGREALTDAIKMIEGYDPASVEQKRRVQTSLEAIKKMVETMGYTPNMFTAMEKEAPILLRVYFSAVKRGVKRYIPALAGNLLSLLGQITSINFFKKLAKKSKFDKFLTERHVVKEKLTPKQLATYKKMYKDLNSKPQEKLSKDEKKRRQAYQTNQMWAKGEDAYEAVKGNLVDYDKKENPFN